MLKRFLSKLEQDIILVNKKKKFSQSGLIQQKNPDECLEIREIYEMINQKEGSVKQKLSGLLKK